ncbi:MAG: hypothetical protein CMM57_10020 [Rhodospirillaceae bacterium]|nr:hypothetical protein [Rhodospirillaceae bacterium]
MQDSEDTYKRRQSGPLPLARLLPKLTRKALGKFGFSYIGLITDWATIVGPDIAKMSAPEKLTFPRNKRDSGVLRLKAEGGAALEIQHLEPQILDRINTYFGYRAVMRLNIINGPVNKPKNEAVTSTEFIYKKSLNQKISASKLMHLLERFGRSVKMRESNKKD